MRRSSPPSLALTPAGPFVAKRSEYKSVLTGRVIPLAHYTTAEHLAQTDLALEIAGKALETFETLFKLPYPLPKLDTLTVSAFAMVRVRNAEALRHADADQGAMCVRLDVLGRS